MAIDFYQGDKGQYIDVTCSKDLTGISEITFIARGPTVVMGTYSTGSLTITNTTAGTVRYTLTGSDFIGHQSSDGAKYLIQLRLQYSSSAGGNVQATVINSSVAVHVGERLSTSI